MQKSDVKMFVFILITCHFFILFILTCPCDNFLNSFLSQNFYIRTESKVSVTLSTKARIFEISANLSNLKHFC